MLTSKAAAAILCLAIICQLATHSINSQEIHNPDLTEFDLSNLEKLAVNNVEGEKQVEPLSTDKAPLNIDQQEIEEEKRALEQMSKPDFASLEELFDPASKQPEEPRQVENSPKAGSQLEKLPMNGTTAVEKEETPFSASIQEAQYTSQDSSLVGKSLIHQDSSLSQHQESPLLSHENSPSNHHLHDQSGHYPVGKPSYAHNLSHGDHRNSYESGMPHFAEHDSPTKHSVNDKRASHNTLHASVAPKEAHKIKEIILTAKEGKRNKVSDLRQLFEQSANNNQPDSAISVPIKLIPLMTEHIKCNVSGVVTISYLTDNKSELKFSKEEEKLVKSFEKYIRDAHKLPQDVITQQLVNAKWSMVVLKFFMRAFYRLKRHIESDKREELKGTQLKLYIEAQKQLKKFEVDYKDSKRHLKNHMKDFEVLTEQIIRKNMFLEDHEGSINFNNLPAVDLQAFATLESQSYFKQAPKMCQGKQTDLKDQNMCTMVYLMVSALSDIVVGKHSIVICFLNEGNIPCLTDTVDKLKKLHTEQVLHQLKINKDKGIKDDKLLELINSEWANNLLHQLGDKYQKLRHEFPIKGDEHTKMDSLHKELLVLKSDVEEYHKKIENNKTKHEPIEVKMEEFFKHH